MGYNTWLRDTSVKLSSMLKQNTVRLQAQLSVLLSVLELETGTVDSHRVYRVNQAMIHLMTEMHLLVTMTREAD